MFDWLVNLFMNTTADAAYDAAIYSAGLASGAGVYQAKEPAGLKELAQKRVK